PSSRNEVWDLLLQPSRQIRLDQIFHRGLVHVFASHQGDAGVDPLVDLFSVNMRCNRHNPQISHLHRILQDEATDVPISKPLHKHTQNSERDTPQWTAPDINFKSPNHPGGGQLIRTEHSIKLLDPAQQTFALLVSSFHIGTAVLIGAHHFDSGILL